MHGIQIITLAILLSLLFAVNSSAVFDLFPESIGGGRSAERTSYDRSNLFQFIDGGAEVYLAYGFSQAQVVHYRRDGAPDIVAEAYDMGSPQDAYGVLSIDLTGEKVAIGAEARYGAGLVRFCKGRWFVRVMAMEETKATRDAVLALGRRMADAIAEESPRPAILKLLPSDGLIADSATFFHTRITLNQLYYVADENVLRLGPETDAAIADYRTPKGEAKLVLIHYPDAKRCQDATSAFLAKYLRQKRTQPALPDEVIVRSVEGGRFVGLAAPSSYLALVFEARSAAVTKNLLAQARLRIPGGKADGPSR